MIRPVNGVQWVLPLLDHIVEHKPHLPPLIIGLTSADPAEARAFADGYRGRLADIRGHSLVPNAHTDAVTLRIAKASKTSPDVALLDELAKQLRSSIPGGAGKHWQTKQFSIVLDVVTAAGHVTTTTSDATREALYDLLYTRWEKRKKLLSWTRKMSNADLPGKILGLVLTALLHGPSRWFFGRRLNRRGLRWFGAHVKDATGREGDFLDQAVYLLPDSGLPDVAALHQRVLFDALLHDVAQFTRRRRFLPHRRRRRWTPVLLLDATDPLAASLVDLYSELTAEVKTMPLLVIAALPENALGDGAVHDIEDAAAVLRALVDQEERHRRLVLRMPGTDAPEHPAADQHIKTHRVVTPRIPSRVSAFTPLALTVVLVAGSTAFGGWTYFNSGCSDTMINAKGERVGVIESDCSFRQPAEDAAGVPNLSDLEQEVFQNNRAVDEIRVDNKPQYHREVVFFAPLTRPDEAQHTAPRNAIWQLRGAIKAQRQHNEEATHNASLVPIKLVLANSGDDFSDGAWVASRIAERPRDGDGALAAVIGISQSRPRVRDVVHDQLAGIPVIGASMYGRKMTENNPGMFLAAPTNEAFANKMDDWLLGRRAAVVWDPEDEYFSSDLHELLHNMRIGSDAVDIKITKRLGGTGYAFEGGSAQAICEQNLIPVLTTRADPIVAFLDEMKRTRGCTDGITQRTILAGPGVIVEAATGTLGKRYEWADLTMMCLAGGAVDSEETTGRDAFTVVAAAATEAKKTAAGTWGPAIIQTLLEKRTSTGAEPPRLNDATATDRIHVVDIS
ncbi:hypothetical protein Lesp02_81880 [Lentzea sp. NBRC 105346]|uniref:hypothetical protein n=1 Tax=Lentzea sp. NBRC 105346 TaxID=3032205 RepID=UPI0024A581F0|nr:hypothetical protein [Lentzea sp. NBRC 105346]GLZ36001.1 hypothetical protein Lesp02_81880 [Lentzea sp. NBRC 105346]